MPAYQGYQGATTSTPQEIARTRKLAEALMSEATDASPVQHWTQGLARVVKGGVGGYQAGQAGRMEMAGQQAGSESLARALAGGSMEDAASGLMANPYMAQSGMDLAAKTISNREAQARQQAANAASQSFTLQRDQQAHERAKELLRLRQEMAGQGSSELGLSTIMGRDENGNPVLIQPSKNGRAVQTQLPDGVTLDYGGKARETVMGKAQGEAAADLPSFDRKSQQIVSQIDALLNDPKLSGMTGYSAYLPNVSPSSQGTQARMDQVTGKAFVQAFQDMKGAGAITELEGAKAAAALTRLQNPYQSDADYRAALEEFKAEVQSMADTVRSRASGVRAPQQPQSGGWSIQRVP